MLIKSLVCTTDPETEHVLMIEITFKKVFVVKTAETTVLLENQKSPEATAQVQDGGTVQTRRVSDLKKGVNSASNFSSQVKGWF